MSERSLRVAGDPFRSVSSSDVGAAASTSANGEMLTSHLPSGFAPRDVEPSRKNEQSLYIAEHGEKAEGGIRACAENIAS